MTMDWKFYRMSPQHELRKKQWTRGLPTRVHVVAQVQKCPVCGGLARVAHDPSRGAPARFLAYPHLACFPSLAQCFLSQADFWVFQTKV